MTHRPQCPQRPTSRRTSLPRRTGPVSRSSRPQPPPRKATHDGSKTRLARGPQSSLQPSSTRGFGGHGSICAGHRLFIVGVLLRRPHSACLCPPPELMNVVSGRHLCPTTPISCLISPQSNYAAWEHVVAELTAATSEIAAPGCQRRLRPSAYGRRLAKPAPKPSPSSTHSFLGCAGRKSDFPGTSTHPCPLHRVVE